MSKWHAEIFDSLGHRWLANKNGIIYTRTRKEIKEIAIRLCGKEFFDYCIWLGKD